MLGERRFGKRGGLEKGIKKGESRDGWMDG